MEMQLAGAAAPFACTLITDTMPIVLGLGKVLPASTTIESDLRRMLCQYCAYCTEHIDHLGSVNITQVLTSQHI
jgi:hypothetical protein